MSEKKLDEVFKKCPKFRHHHHHTNNVFWFLMGVSVGISVGYYLFWYLLLKHFERISEEIAAASQFIIFGLCA